MVDLAKLLNDIEDDIDLNEGLGLPAEFSLRCKVAIRELAAERDALKAELEVQKDYYYKRPDGQQKPDSWRVTAKIFCGTHTTDKEVAEHYLKTGEAYPLYKNPIPEKISKEVAQVLINNAISSNPELLELFYSPVPAQKPAVAAPQWEEEAKRAFWHGWMLASGEECDGHAEFLNYIDKRKSELKGGG